MTKNIQTTNFDKEVLQSDIPVLVDFWAPWCNPCRMLSPVVEEAAKELHGRAKVVKVNIDEEADLAAKYGIMSIPTLMVVHQGAVKNKAVGVRPKQEIMKLIE